MVPSRPLSCAILVFFLVLTACGGGDNNTARTSESGDAALPDYTGRWDVRYNLTKDDCRLVASFIPGYVDQHVISQEGSTASIRGLGNILVDDAAVVNPDGSLNAERIDQGAFLGEGSDCDLDAAVSYVNLVDDTAETMMSLSFQCRIPAGYTCETLGIGTAVRQADRNDDAAIFDTIEQ